MLNYIEQISPISELGALVKMHLDETGYVIIKNFDKDITDLDALKVRFRELCDAIGDPVAHDSLNSIIWDIKSNANSKSFIKTYSEHSHEAELHTDSQYSFYPEDYFGLLTLKKANCGGGVSYLLSLPDILNELRSDPSVEKYEKLLREEDYPFVVPNVFKKNESEEREYNWGPILRENEIRFRVDTFEKAIAENPDFCTAEQIEAYQVLKKIILESANIKRFYLEDRDLIFINNKTMLHGRNSFQDPERHLLRIRLNKKGVNL
ncbi:TauD/TfdA family dioxygenase [Roseivirga sp.]|uniref:TauD/TfdA family dioxygenase n=1 Tax=Roseivirga sp. TaxID=1964215 RepID=UPI003B8B6354